MSPAGSFPPIRGFVVSSFALLCALVAGQAEAVQRAYVASYGLDTNTSFGCDVARPCRFFQAATTVVDPNGEVVVLDSGGYGAVTLTQSIALIAPNGVYAGISVFLGATFAGVTIATPGINVVLRGLTINNQGGVSGVYMTAGASLSVENCVIANFSNGYGITVYGAAKVSVVDTLLRNNSGGIFLSDGPVANISGTTVLGSDGFGIYVVGRAINSTTTAAISDTTVSGNYTGIRAESQNTNANVHVSVSRSSVTNGAWGIVVERGEVTGAAVLTLRKSIVTGNNFGLSVASAIGGVLESSGNNTVRQNNFNVRTATDVITQIGQM